MVESTHWDPAVEDRVREVAAQLGLDEEAVELALEHELPLADLPADDFTVAVNRMMSMQRHPSARRPLTIG